jgi:hypothetical protein
MLAEINRTKPDGEFSRDVDGELLIEAIFGAVYYRRLLRTAPLTEEFGDRLVDQGPTWSAFACRVSA